MNYMLLMTEFFKIGLFSFGGGYATIPFLYHLSEVHHWYSINELSQMIAVASITPGPVGINVATYAGLKTMGFGGAVLATISELLPSLIIVILVSKILKKYSENFYVKSVIQTLKPISCALLIAVGFGMLKSEINNINSVMLFAVLILISIKSKKDPLVYMVIAGITGICLGFIK